MRRSLLGLLLGSSGLLLAAAPAFGAGHNITISSGATANITKTAIDDHEEWTANADSAVVNIGELVATLDTTGVTIITGSTGGENGDITVSGAIDTSANTGIFPLELDAAHDITVSSALSLVGPLKLNAPGATALNATTTAFSVVTDAPGTLSIGDDVETTGDPGGEQVYHEPTATIGGTTLFIGSDVDRVAFDGNITMTSDATLSGGTTVIFAKINGAHALTLTASGGGSAFQNLGDITPLSSLTVNGLVTALGATVKTTGDQVYNNGVIADGTVQFMSSSSITIAGFLRSALSLNAADVSVNTGTLFLNGPVGDAMRPPESLHVHAFARIQTASITTKGPQIYDFGVGLNLADPVLATSSDTITFGSTIDSLFGGPGVQHSLTVHSSDVEIDGNVGAINGVVSLSMPAGMTTTFGGGTSQTIHTMGGQSYGNVALTGDPKILQADSGTINIAGGVTLGATNLTFTGAGTVAGAITGTAKLTSNGPGVLALQGASTYSGGTLVAGGTLLVNGTIGDVHVDSSSTLAGTGTTGAVTSVGGIVSPGASPGKLSTGDLLLDSDSKFNAELNGTAPGSGYDQLAVTGTVSLGGAALNLSASGFPHGGAPYVLIDNDGSDPVSGTFAGRPEGSVIDLAGAKLQLSYAGATGNDVTLTVVKQATTTTVTGAPDPVTAGTPVDLTAVVAGPQGFPAPTGTVTFTDGGTTLGTANLAGGSANLTVTSLSAGDHTITATYGGDGDFLGSSGSLNKHVDAAPVVTAAQPTLPTVSVANATGKETDPVRMAAVTKGKLVFVVSLSKTSRTTVAVRFATRNGTARAGKDYKRKAGKLTFRPGVRKLKITVKLLPDNRKEKTEKLKLRLSRPVGATIRRGTAIGTIRDDD